MSSRILRYAGRMPAVLCLLLLTVANSAWAASAPEDFVHRLIDSLKQAGTMAPAVKHIDWSGMFDKMPPEERQALGFSGPADLSAYYQRRADANGADEVERLKAEAAEEGSLTRPSGQERLATVEKELARQQAELRDRLGGSVYEILGSKTEGEYTILTLRRTYEDHSQEVELRLKDQGGSWLLESAAPLNPSSLNSASPLGHLPQPVLVLVQP